MDMQKTITVFTPTFNRAYCLHKCYYSLIKQTKKDFIWLIIDDGSSDNTKEIVNEWINDNKIDIHYHYQENQGMHGAHNTAYSLINTELNVCIDSDDYMPNDAIEHILKCWKNKPNENYAGIIGLDADSITKDIIGSKIPSNLNKIKVYDLYNKYKVKGDKKIVYRTEVVKKYPKYPIFSQERFVPLGYLYQLIDQDYDLIPLNETLCIVEYLQDGSSKNILKQYKRHPRGFAFSRKSRMILDRSFKNKFKNAIHYISCSIFTKNKNFIKESPKKIMTFFAIPFGIILNIYIRIRTMNKFNKQK